MKSLSSDSVKYRRLAKTSVPIEHCIRVYYTLKDNFAFQLMIEQKVYRFLTMLLHT